MKTDMTDKQCEALLSYVEMLVNQHQAAHQTLQRSGRAWQSTYDRQLERSEQTTNPSFQSLFALLRDGDLSTMLDKLNGELGSLVDADE
jgi:hypothetical protein